MAKREMITPPNNSFAARGKTGAVEKRKNVDPSAVHESKKSLGKKFADTFINEDVESVKSYILTDVIIPMIKDLIVGVINQGTDMIFYGRSGGYKGASKKNYGTASYQSYYSGGSKPASSGAPTRDTSEISFDTRRLAWDVLEEMRAVVEQYDNLSIVDYHDIVEKVTGFCPSSNYTDDKYGWTDLSRVDVKMDRGGRYILTLPKAVLLD